MSTLAAAPPELLDKLLTASQDRSCEMVEGELVERDMGAESGAIAALITYLLMSFVRPRQLGTIFDAETGLQCFPSPDKNVRKADVSFVSATRMALSDIPKGHLQLAPDLAVEVVSPNDLADEVDQKVELYLDAGVRLVWVVSAATRSVRIHRPHASPRGPISILTDADTIDGEDVLPGFTTAVSDFFPPKRK